MGASYDKRILDAIEARIEAIQKPVTGLGIWDAILEYPVNETPG